MLLKNATTTTAQNLLLLLLGNSIIISLDTVTVYIFHGHNSVMLIGYLRHQYCDELIQKTCAINLKLYMMMFA